MPLAAPLSARCCKWDLCWCNGPLSPLLRLLGGWLTCFQDWDFQCLRGTNLTPVLQKQRCFEGLAARGLVFSLDPNLLDNLIPPCHRAGCTKPTPAAHHKVEENCFKPTGSCASSHYHQPQLTRRLFVILHDAGICDMEQLVSLDCLEKRICLGQIYSSFSLGKCCPQRFCTLIICIILKASPCVLVRNPFPWAWLSKDAAL